MPSPAEALAAEVRAALEALRDGGETSLMALRVRQQKAYTALWTALERYEKAAERRKGE